MSLNHDNHLKRLFHEERIRKKLNGSNCHVDYPSLCLILSDCFHERLFPRFPSHSIPFPLFDRWSPDDLISASQHHSFLSVPHVTYTCNQREEPDLIWFTSSSKNVLTKGEKRREDATTRLVSCYSQLYNNESGGGRASGSLIQGSGWVTRKWKGWWEVFWWSQSWILKISDSSSSSSSYLLLCMITLHDWKRGRNSGKFFQGIFPFICYNECTSVWIFQSFLTESRTILKINPARRRPSNKMCAKIVWFAWICIFGPLFGEIL